MQEALKQVIETVLQGLFDEEIENTRLNRISKEISKFGGVRD